MRRNKAPNRSTVLWLTKKFETNDFIATVKSPGQKSHSGAMLNKSLFGLPDPVILPHVTFFVGLCQISSVH